MVASETELKWRAMRLGELAAIRSEEYAAAHPEEIARRRLFFRRLLEECRWSSRSDATASMVGSAKSIRSLW